MCGRYTFFNNIDSLQHSLNIDVIDSNIIDHQASYNISPTQNAPVVFQDNNNRILKNMRWGLIPSWAKDNSFASKLINARAETIADKPSFKNLITTNRCVVLANGYYEWVNINNKKQPYFIYSGENTMISMAGLWTEWKDVISFTIITKQSETSISHLHHRMPLMLPKEKIDSYLDKNNAFDDFIIFDDMKLKYHQVSRLVNSPKNNNASCINPIHQ
jgi:putative SOS response-associated peptidase YedK